MMGRWPSVIATNPADPEAPARATLWADPFRTAVRAFYASRMISSCRQLETLAYAQDLLDGGLAFNAHKVLEAAWKNGPDDERMLWQGLAQLAVGITHIQRGNVKGAITLLRRASARLAHDDRPAPYAIEAAHLVAYAVALIADLAAGAEIPPKRLRPRLVAVLPL
jgi:predicted metal-dependent hydrolase